MSRMEERVRAGDEAPEDLDLGPRFRILRRLGSGSFGVVYEAHDRDRDEVVAIKLLAHLTPDALYRFKREFRSLADLRHPNVIRLYELLSSGDRWFFTMEFVDGEPFAWWARGDAPYVSSGYTALSTVSMTDRRPLSIDEAAGPIDVAPATPRPIVASPPNEARLRSALPQLAAGVEALHRAGKLHRDLKSHNVLVRRDGRVAILDFGVVGDVDPALQDPSFPGLVGTPSYMAPEQILGAAVPASDWYSVGVMLFEALTGDLPFPGPPKDVLALKRMLDATDPRSRVAGLPHDLSELCLALLRRQPEERPTGAEVLARLGVEPLASAQPAESAEHTALETSVLGREAERDAIGEAFAETRDAMPVVVHLRGASGMGKTALLRQVLVDLAARHGVVVFEGRCFERESVPYKALDEVIDAIQRHLLRLPAVEVAQLLPRDIGPLARLFPVLDGVPVIAAAPRLAAARDPHEQRRRACVALRELTARTADRRPVVIAIDDLQWGDADSARLLADLLRPPDAPALLLILCARSEDADASAFLRVFSPATADVLGHTIEVGPLEASQARRLALELMGPQGEERAEAVARESGGNPYFIHELVRHIQSGPAGSAAVTLAEVLAARVESLPATARQLLEVIAVAGRPLPGSAAMRAAEIEGDDGRAALAELESARLVRTTGPRGDELETAHDRVRQTAVARLDPAGLRQRHAALAAALEAREGTDPEWLAAHFTEAGEYQTAARYAAVAAGRAASALAFDRASRLYASALELYGKIGLDLAEPEDLRALRVGLGEALAYTGRGVEAADAYLAAVEEEGDAAQRLECRRRAAEQLLGSGHLERGLGELTSVLRETGLAVPATPAGALAALVGNRAMLRLRGLKFEPRSEQDIPARDLMAIDVCYIAGVNLALGDMVRGAVFQARGLRRALRAGELRRIGRALAIEAGYQAALGARAMKRAQRLAAESERIAREVGDPILFAYASVASGLTCYFGGRFREAVEHLLLAEDQSQEGSAGLVWERHHVRTYRLASLHFMGAHRELDRLFEKYVREAEERGDTYAQATLRRWFNGVWLARDDADGAREDLARVSSSAVGSGFELPLWLEERARAGLELYAGLTEGAVARVEAAYKRLRRSMWVRSGNIRREALWLRGRVALAAGEPSLVGRLVKKLAREKLPHTSIWSDLLSAGLALREGEGERGADLLRAVAERATALNLAGCAAAARYHLAPLVGGAEGDSLRAGAEVAMRRDGAVNPGKMAYLILPVRS